MNKGTSTAPSFPFLKQIATPGYIAKYSSKTNSKAISSKDSLEISQSPRCASRFISLRNPNYLSRAYRNSQLGNNSIVKNNETSRRDVDSDIPTFVYDLLGEEVKPTLKARSSLRDKYQTLIAESKSNNPKHEILLITSQEKTAKTAEASRLRYRSMLRGKKQGFKTYEDYSIGGSMYNKDVANPLYHPRVIRFSPRSSVRIFTTNPENQSYKSKLKKLDKLGQVSISRYISSRKNSTDCTTIEDTSKFTQDMNKPDEVEKPARNFAEKIYRIRELTLDKDIADIKEIMNRTVF